MLTMAMSYVDSKDERYPTATAAEILAADDEEAIREMVQDSLNQEFDVKTVNDGEEVWDYLRDHPDSVPEIIILDVMMSKLDGFSVLDRIREHDEIRDIPIVMLTARSREEDVVRALEAGADDFLAKPFGKSELNECVQRIHG